MKNIGDIVKWSTSRKPLGKVVHIFYHKDKKYVVVEKEDNTLIVCRDYELLLKVPSDL